MENDESRRECLLRHVGKSNPYFFSELFNCHFISLYALPLISGMSKHYKP